jgi:hypothetical protein
MMQNAMDPLPARASQGRAPDNAAFRAFWAKFTLATAKRAPEPMRSLILQAIGAELRAEIRKAATLEWLPARVFVDLTGAIASCDERLAVAFWRYSLNQSIAQPLISTLVDGGISVFGRSPMALYKRTPRAWSLVSRECGEVSVEEGTQPRTALVRLAGVAPDYRTHPGLPLLLAGGLRGQADFCKESAEVEMRLEQYASSGLAEFRVRW